MEAGPRSLLRWVRATVFVAMLAGVLIPVGATASDGAGPLLAVTDGGLLRGTQHAGVREFLGVPYAAPPVGDLRWRAPQAHARWGGVRDATSFGAHCAQPAGSFGVASTSEDCL
ncbi:MAG TPA: carboxylesterase family protein, partial [Candidatus Dormibacteraeota bacterium]|nr:carboxylesterase family protein [Candidatus Dormibacteraeota bacterium]